MVKSLGIGSILFALAAQTVPAVQLTIFALGEPLLAPLWAWVGVGEVPSWTTMIGGGVLFSALGFQVSARYS